MGNDRHGRNPPPIVIAGVAALTEALTEIAKALRANTKAVNAQTTAIVENTEVLKALVPKAQPKASRITSKPSIETEEELPMPVQLYPTQHFKDTFRFNGPVDDEPVVSCNNPFVTLTQDPKVTEPTPDTADYPDWVDTLVTVHGVCNDPTNPAAVSQDGGMISLRVSATVDKMGTDEVEKVAQDFTNEFQFIAPSQAKASSISSAPAIEE